MVDKNVEYMIQVAKHQSLLRAAQQLYITPSALSKHLQKVEQELGSDLFHRVGKRYILTYAGERYLDWCLKISDLYLQMSNEMSNIANLEKGRIRIGYPLIRSKHIISKVIPEFRWKYPNIEIALSEDSTTVITKKLENSELDMIFINVDEEQSNFSYELVIEEEMVLAVPEDRLLPVKGEPRKNFRYPWVELTQFAEDDFVMVYPSQKIRMVADRILEAHKINPRITMQTRALESSLFAVVSGLGVTIAPDQPLLQMDLDSRIKMFSFGDQPVIRRFMIVYRKNTYFSRAALDLIRILKESYV